MTGSGTALDPFIIWDVNDLQDMDLDLTAYYELGSNIDCSGIANFQPVGGWGGVAAFTGSFDGKGYIISNLTINRPADDYIGLFGETDGTPIRDVTIEATITGDDNVGTLVGQSNGGTFTHITIITTIVGDNDVGGMIGDTNNLEIITNCVSSGSVASHNDSAGGLIGESNFLGSLVDCHSSCSVSGAREIGGLIGADYSAAVPGGSLLLRCYATGNVTAAGDYIGGLIGDAYGTRLTQCFATGNVSTSTVTANVGGLVGDNNNTAVPYTDCYATGNVTATDVGGGHDIGGLVGDNSTSLVNCYSTGLVTAAGVGNWDGGLVGDQDNANGASASNCFWDTQTSGEANAVGAGLATGITGLTSAEMVYGKAFAVAGWVQTIWRLNDGYYPCLIGVSPSCAYSPIPYPPWPPLPPTPPPPIIVTAIVGTLPATNIAENHATLNGVLTNSLAKYGEVRFQYGTTSAYGMNTPWQDGFFTGDDFYANIVNVGEGSVYHFRAQFRGSPIVSGSDMTFSTLSSLGPVTMVSEELMQILEA